MRQILISLIKGVPFCVCALIYGCGNPQGDFANANKPPIGIRRITQAEFQAEKARQDRETVESSPLLSKWEREKEWAKAHPKEAARAKAEVVPEASKPLTPQEQGEIDIKNATALIGKVAQLQPDGGTKIILYREEEDFDLVAGVSTNLKDYGETYQSAEALTSKGKVTVVPAGTRVDVLGQTTRPFLFYVLVRTGAEIGERWIVVCSEIKPL